MNQEGKRTYRFGIRKTPKGAVAWMEAPSGRKQEKQFFNGYAGAETSAQKRIDEWIVSIKEMIELEEITDCDIIETHKKDG
jgi:hypothetical protein